MITKNGYLGAEGFMYDEMGHMIGEYSSAGALIEETIWMGDIPVAVIVPSGSTIAGYYIHTDHLGTPRRITRPSDNALMWRWDPGAFGNTAANSNPSGLGTFTYNLRLPGMYYQAESALFQNYFRDYAPNWGSYGESDPIGLDGGSYSTYAYAGGNPVGNSDARGLLNPGEAACLGGPNPVCDVSIVVDVIATIAEVTAATATIADIETARRARDAANAKASANSGPPDDDGSC